MKVFGGMLCVPSNGWLYFGGDPDFDMDTEIFNRNFTTARDRAILRILLII